MTDQPNAFAGQDAEREILEYSLAVRVREIDMLEFDAGATADERLGVRIVAQFMRHQKRSDRFRKPRDMLRDIDQSYGEVACRIKH
jgi:hypothetical protein